MSRYKVGVCLIVLLPHIFSSCYHGPSHMREMRVGNTNRDFKQLEAFSEIPDRPLTVEDAIEVARQRNLDLYVKQQELAIQYEKATGKKMQMIPSLISNLEISQRNKNTGSASESLVPNIPPAPPSISSEQHVIRSDTTFTWNLLEFGINYYRYRAEVDRTLMLAIAYERLEQNLIMDVVQQYWKVVALRQAVNRSACLLQRIDDYKKKLDYFIAQQILPRTQTLEEQQRILELVVQIEDFSKDYETALYELKNKMGVPPWMEIELADCLEPIEFCLDDVQKYEEVALFNRPELYAYDVEEKMRSEEVRAAYLQLVPSVALFAAHNYDANRFLIFNNWLTAGMRASYNLFNIPYYLSDSRVATKNKESTRRSRLAMSMGVVSQVNLSYNVYYIALDYYKRSREFFEVNNNLFYTTSQEYEAGRGRQGEVLYWEAEAFVAETNALKAYSEVQNALEHLNNAMGIARYVNNTQSVEPVCEEEDMIISLNNND